MKVNSDPLGGNGKIIINHDSSQYTGRIGQGFTSFFKNTDLEQCPVNSCELR